MPRKPINVSFREPERAFKTTKDSLLAQYLLEFTDGEQRMKLRRSVTKDGYVHTHVLLQYFGKASMRKAYPEKDVERVLSILVRAGLLKQTEIRP